jgi:hypothetical protein
MKQFHILNLGAGVQSTALYLMSARREFNIPWFDAAIFADTGEEPQDVYRHVEWLQSLKGPEILVRSTGMRLGDDLVRGGSRGKRGTQGFASIPAFTIAKSTGKVGKMKRQCTKEYKTEVIDKVIRQEIFGMKSRERIGWRFFAQQYLGLSAEETTRVRNNLRQFHLRRKWTKAHFPL